MGYSRWDDSMWSSYSATTSTKAASAIFTSRTMHPDLNPLGVVVRESRDSDVNPESTAIIVGVDVTGSMGIIADYFVKEGLGVLFTNILDRKPVTDPHLMVMAIGDAKHDRSPLQVSQFEADLKIAEQLEKVHVEHGGGNNNYESYELPWYFAAHHTSIDCWEKRKKKGYLFTIGDEFTPPKVLASQVKELIGDTPQADIELKDMYDLVSRMYHTFHIVVAEGNCARTYGAETVRDKWAAVMGQNVVILTDYHKLSEVIESIIEVTEGADKDHVTSSWSGDTSLVVKDAISGLGTAIAKASSNTGIVTFS